MAKYQHVFVCKQCDELASFVDSEKVSKGATFETGCSCGITTHVYYATRVIK